MTHMVSRTRIGGPLVALALLAGSAACTAAEDADGARLLPPGLHHPGGAVTGTTVGTERSVVVRTRVTRVAGRVPAAARVQLVARVDRIVTGYVEGLVDGSADPYAHFTPGARRLAAASDRPRLPARLRAGPASAYLAVLAPQGRILGVTARFRVPLLPDRDAGPRRAVADLSGRLLLTPTQGGWRVFGYDVTWPDGGRSRLEGSR